MAATSRIWGYTRWSGAGVGVGVIVVDGDQDRDRGFEDLGNAVRKIWIDLGVRITFNDSGLLATELDAELAGIPYFALGTIEYVSDPKIGEPLETPTGKILYIKPVVRGDELPPT